MRLWKMVLNMWLCRIVPNLSPNLHSVYYIYFKYIHIPPQNWSIQTESVEIVLDLQEIKIIQRCQRNGNFPSNFMLGEGKGLSYSGNLSSWRNFSFKNLSDHFRGLDWNPFNEKTIQCWAGPYLDWDILDLCILYLVF